ncbi:MULTISPECIES: hypothetical protein [unclassified Kitasatospora]|uniref:hypothetical protein n=1 Tax=unclassified Kitasatospora TaxID=2633591 RepID=UPI001AE04857|nr:hypothetical protein [Kitasatospora sp. RG8]MBP0450384.1 hypothetical protein [Kitasatospora sp. RG8]
MIQRICPWWFLHCSRAPVARLLRAERRRLDAELSRVFPAASARIRERVLASLASQHPR